MRTEPPQSVPNAKSTSPPATAPAFQAFRKGLQELGYDIHYVERMSGPGEAYDPRTSSMTDDPAYAVRYLRSTLARHGIDDGAWTFVDLEGTFHGADRAALDLALDRADFVLNVTDPVWFDELARCERRAYVDGDPMFTQVALEIGAKTGEWDAADEGLKSFAHMAVAAQVGCSWCLDIGYFQALNQNHLVTNSTGMLKTLPGSFCA